MQLLFVLLISVFSISSAIAAPAGESVLNVTPYGYVKFDAIYETGNSSHGNAAFWAVDPGASNGLFHATANQTRLGLNVSAGKLGDFTLGGKVEVDFYGGGAENKAFNYMRHAYLEIKNDRWTFIAGQYWDIINPLNPFTLNYPVLWSSGNIGYRRPQLSFQHNLQAGKILLTMQGGIFRTIAGDLDRDGLDDGVAAGLPTLQGRLAARIPLADQAFLQLGLSGHSGKSSGLKDYSSNSLNLDLILSFSGKLTLLGEFFNGKNMLPFFGAVNQGVNQTLEKEISASGFYLNLQAGLAPGLKMSAGYGQDQPRVQDLSAGMRVKNSTVFANLVYNLGKQVSAGFEIYHISTAYQGLDNQKTLRFQHSWMLSF